MFLTAFHPAHWHSEILDIIIARLDNEERFLLITASKSLWSDRWKRMPSIRRRLTEAAQIEALNLFRRNWSNAPSALLGSQFVMKITHISNTHIRRAALKDWADNQDVCIDQGGFYVQRMPNIDFGRCEFPRVRIGLWDCPFEYRYTFYGNLPNNFVATRNLKAEFFQRGYSV
jgi:hypothetical protein